MLSSMLVARVNASPWKVVPMICLIDAQRSRADGKLDMTAT
jgi:hypothetical protein